MVCLYVCVGCVMCMWYVVWVICLYLYDWSPIGEATSGSARVLQERRGQ